MKFTENLPLTVQRPPRAGGGAAEGVLYGSVQGEYLIAGGFGKFELEIGEELMVRIASSGQMLGFWTKVLDRIDRRGTLYLLSFPEQVDALNMRKAERMNLFVPVQIRLTGGSGDGHLERFFEGALVNISVDGCRLNAKTMFEDNPWCELRFRLPGVDEEFVVSGRVLRGAGAHPVAGVGVEFQQEGESFAAFGAIREWIDSNLPLAQEP